MKRILLGWSLLLHVGKKFYADHGFFLASGLSFDILLYCLPLLFLFAAGLAYTLVSSDQALMWVQGIVKDLLPGSEQLLLDTVASIMANRGVLGFTGFFMFLIFSSTVFGSARHVLCQVFHKHEPESFLKGKGLDFLLMLATSALLLLTAVAGSALSLIQSFGETIPSIRSLLSPLWLVTGKVLGFMFLSLGFYVFYRFATLYRMRQSALWLGSFTGATLFELSKWAFSYYVSIAKIMTTFYGVLSGLVFFIIWIYYASVVFILGAEMGWIYDQFQKRKSKAKAG